MDDTEIFAHHDLAQPIAMNGEPVQRITIRRLDADRRGEARATEELAQAFVASNFWWMVASRLSGLSLSAILRLPHADRAALKSLAGAAWTDAYGADKMPSNLSDTDLLAAPEAPI